MAYITRQRKLLINCLEAHEDSLFTPEEIIKELEPRGISQSAVYRNLASMESQGVLKRTSKEGSKAVYYQYLDSEECRNSFHLSCVKCGRTIHMDSETAEKLVESVRGIQDFDIDKGESVMYGTCKECRKK